MDSASISCFFIGSKELMQLLVSELKYPSSMHCWLKETSIVSVHVQPQAYALAIGKLLMHIVRSVVVHLLPSLMSLQVGVYRGTLPLLLVMV